MKLAVLVSYYDRPDMLALCLHSLSLQTRKPDQLILLDDGSQYVPPLDGVDMVIHQPHDGFGKERLSNRALVETDCDYIVVTDQDCIFPPHWLEIHQAIARPGQYVCGMYTSLTEEESKWVTKSSISDRSIWGRIPRGYAGEPHVWAGCGSAVWRKDALAVNGFDTRFGCTGPDYNFGLRLERLGLSWIHTSVYTRWLHLWHERPWMADRSDYKSGDRTTANRLAEEWAKEAVTPYGIEQQDFSRMQVVRFT